MPSSPSECPTWWPFVWTWQSLKSAWNMRSSTQKCSQCLQAEGWFIRRIHQKGDPAVGMLWRDIPLIVSIPLHMCRRPSCWPFFLIARESLWGNAWKEQRRRIRNHEKWGSSLHAFLPDRFMLMPLKLQKYEDPSSKIIKFHIMKDLTDPQPTTVQREHRIH
jgi:hypothetical protein